MADQPVASITTAITEHEERWMLVIASAPAYDMQHRLQAPAAQCSKNAEEFVLIR